jgi:hypothetical protein
MTADLNWQPPATEWERRQLADRISRHPEQFSAREVNWFLDEYFESMPWHRKASMFARTIEWRWSFLGAFWGAVPAFLVLIAFSGGGFLVFGMAVVAGGYSAYLFAGGNWRLFIL